MQRGGVESNKLLVRNRGLKTEEVAMQWRWQVSLESPFLCIIPVSRQERRPREVEVLSS